MADLIDDLEKNKQKNTDSFFKKKSRYASDLEAMEDLVLNIGVTDENDPTMMDIFGSLEDIFNKINDFNFCKKNALYYAKKYKCAPKVNNFIAYYNNESDGQKEGISINYDDFKMLSSFNNNTSELTDGFYFKINYRLEDEDENVRWVLQIFQRDTEEVLTIEVSNDDFSNVKNMKKLFLAKRLTLIITENQLSQLHAFLLKFNPKDAKKATRYGFDDTTGAYIFANGVVFNNTFYEPNENGIVDVNSRALAMPFFSEKKVKNHWFQYITENQSFDLKHYMKYFAIAHGRSIAVPCISHYIFSIFRDVVIAKLGISPHLFLKGPAGSGKSSIARNILTLFGIPPREGNINLKSNVTGPAMNRIFTHYSNFPLWVDEYSTDHPIEGLIQAAYDNSGIIKAKGTNGNYNTGNQVETTPLTCSLMITTNFFPSASNEPLFSRLIYVPANNNNREAHQIQAYEILRNYETTGLSHITGYVVSFRDYFEKEFLTNYHAIFNRLKKIVDDRNINDRLIINQAVIIASYHIMNKKISFDMPEDMTHDMMLDRAINTAHMQIIKQHEQMKNNSPLRIYFEILQLMYTNRQLAFNKNYKFKMDEAAGELLILRFDNIWGYFKSHYRHIYKRSEPDQNTIKEEFVKLLELPSSENLFKHHTFESIKNDNDFFEITTKAFSCKYCIELPYEMIQDRYGIDFNNR
jgi:hypothetical protein